MKEHVFIYQPGNIPGHRIIEELTGRGFKNPNEFFAMARGWYYTSFGNIYFTNSPIMIPGYTELTYEDDKFVEVKSWMFTLDATQRTEGGTITTTISEFETLNDAQEALKAIASVLHEPIKDNLEGVTDPWAIEHLSNAVWRDYVEHDGLTYAVHEEAYL